MKLTSSNIIKVLGLDESTAVVSVGYETGCPDIIIPEQTEELTRESMNLYITWVGRNENISLDTSADLLSRAFNAQYSIQPISSHHDGIWDNEEHVFHYRLLPRIQWAYKRDSDITTKQIITTLGLNKNQYDDVAHKFLNDGHSFVLYNTSAITDLLTVKRKIEHSKISAGYLVSVRKTNKQNVEILFTKIIHSDIPSKLFTPRYIGSIFGLSKNEYKYIDISKIQTLCGYYQYNFELDVELLDSVYGSDKYDYFDTIYLLLGEKPPTAFMSANPNGHDIVYKWVAAYSNACKKLLSDYIGSEYDITTTHRGSTIQFNVMDRIHKGCIVELDTLGKMLESISPEGVIPYDAMDINKETVAAVCHLSSRFITDYEMLKVVVNNQPVQYLCSFRYHGFLSDDTISSLRDEWSRFYNIEYREHESNERGYEITIKFQQVHTCNHIVRLTYCKDLSIKEMQQIINNELLGKYRDDIINNTDIDTNEYQLAISDRLDQCKLSTISIFAKYFEG